ncbi:MAG TPA: glycosyltransferase family 9 protein, partial [Candidatus Omnitrophota bacterium]|nr:glycosyltransferase family 9 protein [Candidatus Omnitrophota bacterium]
MRSIKGDYRSFLVINPFGIGDCLFSTPLLQCIRQHFPAAKIYFLCNKKCYPIMAAHPLVEKAFVYERDEFVVAQKTSFFAWLSMASRFISEIRRERIEACLDLSLNTQYGFYASLAGIRDRYGLDYKNRCFFLTKKLSVPGFAGRHVADFYLSVMSLLGLETGQYPMSVGISAEDHDWARRWMAEQRIPSVSIVVGIAPCGGDSFGPNAHIRRWPAKYYSALIGHLRSAYDARVLVFAGPKESEDVREIIGLFGAGEHKHPG